MTSLRGDDSLYSFLGQESGRVAGVIRSRLNELPSQYSTITTGSECIDFIEYRCDQMGKIVPDMITSLYAMRKCTEPVKVISAVEVNMNALIDEVHSVKGVCFPAEYICGHRLLRTFMERPVHEALNWLDEFFLASLDVPATSKGCNIVELSSSFNCDCELSELKGWVKSTFPQQNDGAFLECLKSVFTGK
ncbi:MAG: hypothetical protein ACNI27_14765 [Desulfovibrio sp.]